MKKFIILSLVGFFALQLSAQDKKFSGGLYATTGLSWLSPENEKLVENTGMGFSYKIGGELDKNIGENFSFCFALQYGRNSASLSFTDTIFNFKTDNGNYIIPAKNKISYKMNFVDVPIFLKFKTNEIGGIRYLLKAGANFSVGLTPRANFTGINKDNFNITDDNLIIQNLSAYPAESVEKAVIKGAVTPINFGVVIGGGIEYDFGGGARLLVELNYNRNLIDNIMTETNKNRADYKTEKDINPVARLNAIELKVGILF